MIAGSVTPYTTAVPAMGGPKPDGRVWSPVCCPTPDGSNSNPAGLRLRPTGVSLPTSTSATLLLAPSSRPSLRLLAAVCFLQTPFVDSAVVPPVTSSNAVCRGIACEAMLGQSQTDPEDLSAGR